MRSTTDTHAIPKRPGVYRVVCIPTGDSYLGATVNLASRCVQHCSPRVWMRGERLQAAYLKYGPRDFRFEVLELCDVDSLNAREIAWWEKLRPTLNTNRPSVLTRRRLNRCRGGRIT